MRSFGYLPENFIPYVPAAYTPQDDEKLYQKSVYDDVMYDSLPDGSLLLCDMTQILLNQEKFRHLLGDANIQKIIGQMHPSASTPMDGMTDAQRFDAVVSRHCQTMSERQAVLSELASRFGDFKTMMSEIQKEATAETAKASAPAAAE